MWTRAYWQTVGERVLGGAAAGVLSVVGLDGATTGTVDATPKSIGLAALFGALTALCVSLVSTPVGAQGTPFVTRQPRSAVEPLPMHTGGVVTGGGHVARPGRHARPDPVDPFPPD